MGRALIVLCKYKYKYKLGEKDGRIEIDDNSQHYAAKAKWVTGSSLFFLILAYSTLIISEFGMVTTIVVTMRTTTMRLSFIIGFSWSGWKHSGADGDL